MGSRRTFGIVGAMLIAFLWATPGSALGSQWLMEGKPIGEPVEIGLTGTDELSFLGSTFKCPVHTVLEAEASGGRLIEFETETAKCEGSGLFGSCKPTHRELTKLPDEIDPGENEIVITGVKIFTTYKECPFSETETTAPKFTATLETPAEITTLEVHTGVTTHVNTPFKEGAGEAGEYHAWLEVDAPNAGTYGIG